MTTATTHVTTGRYYADPFWVRYEATVEVERGDGINASIVEPVVAQALFVEDGASACFISDSMSTEFRRIVGNVIEAWLNANDKRELIEAVERQLERDRYLERG
jgi:hypothetical protein